MRNEGFADVMRQLGENQESRFLEFGIVRGDALEHEREKLGPLVFGENGGGELGNGIAELLGHGFGGLGLERGEEEGLEGGLGVGGEAGPEEGVIVGELAAEEDDGHGPGLGSGRGLQDVEELEKEGIRVGLLAEVEEGFGLGSLVVAGGHKMRD